MDDKQKYLQEQEKQVKEVVAYNIRKSGIPLTQLAKLSKLSVTTVRNLANQKFLPTVVTLFKISRGMGLTVAQTLSKPTDD